MENFFVPAETKPQSLQGFQALRAISHYCLQSPCTKNWVLPRSHSKLYTTAFLHMKQASKKRDLAFFSPKSHPTPGEGQKPNPPTRFKTQATFQQASPIAQDICIRLAATCLGRAGLDRRKVISRYVPAVSA